MFKYIYIIILLFLSLSSFSQNENNNENRYQYALIEATRQKTFGNFEEAIKLYLKCLEYNEDCTVAHYELGLLYAATKDPELAIEHLKMAYEDSPDNYWYVFAYNQILQMKGNFRDAARVLTNYLKNEENTNLMFELALAYEGRKKYSKALEIVQKIENENGVSEKISLKKIELWKKMKKEERGVKEFKKLISLIPESPHYYILFAEYLKDMGRKEEAIEQYEKAYQVDTMNVFAITNLADYYTADNQSDKGFYYLNRAFSISEIDIKPKLQAVLYYLSSDDFTEKYKDKIETLLTTLRNVYPDDYDLKTVVYDFYNKIGDSQKAYVLLKELLKTKKDNFTLWQQVLYSASINQEYRDMINLGNEALKYYPNKPYLNLFIGIGYTQLEKFDSAYQVLIDSYEKVDDTYLTQYYYFLAENAYKIGKNQESWRFFELLLEIDPENDGAKNNYSYYLSLERQNLKRAKELSYQTVLNNPENPVYLDTYGWILFELGSYDEAKVYIEKSIKFNNYDSDILFHYAEILSKLKNYDEALRYYRKALEKGYSVDLVEEKILIITNEMEK